jgi:hypothetical protein
MKVPCTKLATLTLVTLSLVPPGSQLNSQTPPQQRILFAVWAAQKGKQPDTPLLDPIVILEGSELRKLPEYDYDKQKESDEASDRFEKTYFGPGQEYPLLFGGSKLGVLVVDKAVGISCVSQTASVRTTVPVPNGQKALAATSLQGIGLHANWRKPPTPEQQSSFLKVASDFLTHQRVASAAAPAIKVRNLRATRLGEKGSEALVGSVSLLDESGVHNLFLLVEQKSQDWEIGIAAQHDANSEDSPSDVEENFLDQLDLDSDGIDEIVTISGYYESWDYSIYRKEESKWKKVYQGGGGGC